MATQNLGGGQFRSAPGENNSYGEIMTSAMTRSSYMRNRNNPAIKKMREALLESSQTWPMADKLDMIMAAGEMHRIYDRNDEDHVNQVFAEVVITRLDTSDITRYEAVVKEQKRAMGNILEKKIASDRENARRATAQSKRRMAAANNEARLNQMINMGNVKMYQRRLKDMEQSFRGVIKHSKKLGRASKVPKAMISKYKGLAKELRFLLQNSYTDLDIARIANEMQIPDIDPNMPKKAIVEDIVAYTLIYVNLVLGKASNKGFFVNIVDPKPYEELLLRTSHAFVVGQTTTSKRVFAQKYADAMKAAKANKQLEQEQLALMRARKANSKSIFGIIPRYLNRRGWQNRVHEFDDLSRDELILEAHKIGVKNPERLKDDKLKELLAKSYNKTFKARDRLAKKQGKIDAYNEDGTKRKHKSLSRRKASKLAGVQSALSFGFGGPVQKTSNGVPVFDIGSDISNIMQAVPVLVINDMMGSEEEQLPEEVVELVNKIFSSGSSQLDKVFKTLTSQQSALGGNIQMKDREIIKMLAQQGFSTEAISDIMSTIVKFKNGEMSTKDKQEFITGMAIDNDNSFDTISGLFKDVKVGLKGQSTDISDPIMEMIGHMRKISNKNVSIYGPGYALKGQVGIVKSGNILAAGGISDEIISQAALPVYMVNKSIYANTDIGKIFPALIETIAQFIPLPGMSMVGKVAGDRMREMMGHGDESLGDLLSNPVKFATGGSGSASSSISHFISGDSLTSKPNPEQVSIDWASKSFSVKPIPQYATGVSNISSADNGIKSVNRMTSSERGKPMSIGISNMTVTYNKQLQGISDTSDNMALKTYSINTGIDEEIQIGDRRASLMGLVASIEQRLVNMEVILSAGNDQRGALIEATTNVVRKIGTIGSTGDTNPFVGGFSNLIDNILDGN